MYKMTIVKSCCPACNWNAWTKEYDLSWLFYSMFTKLISILIPSRHPNSSSSESNMLMVSISWDSEYQILTTYCNSLFFNSLSLFRNSKCYNWREITRLTALDYLYHLLGAGQLSCWPFEQHHMLDVELQHLVVKQRKNQMLVNRMSTLYASTSPVEAEQELYPALAQGWNHVVIPTS